MYIHLIILIIINLCALAGAFYVIFLSAKMFMANVNNEMKLHNIIDASARKLNSKWKG